MQIQSWHSDNIMKKGIISNQICQPTDSKVTQETPSILQFQKIQYPIHRCFPPIYYFRFSYQDFVWVSLLFYVCYIFRVYNLHKKISDLLSFLIIKIFYSYSVFK
jgi:hypothetical protein